MHPTSGTSPRCMPDGAPKVEPVWLGREGDRLLVATDGKSFKARNRRAIPGSRSLGHRASIPTSSCSSAAGSSSAGPTTISSSSTPSPRSTSASRSPAAAGSRVVVLVIEPTLARAYISPLADLVARPPAARRPREAPT